MADKAAKKPTAAPPKTVVDEDSHLPSWKCYLLLIIAAYWSPVSQFALSPTHGAIPASLYHNQLTTNALLATVPLDIVFLYILPTKEKPFLLPVLNFCIPPIQHYLTPYTLQLGPGWSALVIEVVTYGLLVALTLNITWQRFQSYLPGEFKEPFRTFLPPLVAGVVLFVFERKAWTYFSGLSGTGFIFSRAFAPLILSFATAALLPSKFLLLAVAPFLHTILMNPHMPLDIPGRALNETLTAQNYTLLARQESVTGYISVLQNDQAGFRVMRCDHSLLGGEWVYGVGGWPGGVGFIQEHSVVGEPVYSVFVMLEAVRLVQGIEDGQPTKSPVVPDNEAKALVVGLGIGTTPSALVAHGIDTTVVELDPVVVEFARDYFALPKNLTTFVQDATVFVDYAPSKYDYIVHDVFTGGAEPAELFTVEFITKLRFLLKDDGVIAINYAGDLLLPPASLIVRTILSIFPVCKVYREDAPKENPTVDFTNIIFYCRKKRQDFSFREPVHADYLMTMARNDALVPRYKVDTSMFDLTGERDGIGKVLSSDDVSVLKKWRAQGAIGHWEVMRTVLPPVVWENW